MKRGKEGQQGQENYLRVIYELLAEKQGEKQGEEKQEAEVKSIDIANKLEITKASVSEMIKKLAEQGLVTAHPYSSIQLTKKGKKKAEEISYKHNTIEKIAKKLNHDKAHESAHELEHAFSLELVKKLDNFIEGKQLKEEKLKSTKPGKTSEEKKQLPSYIS